MFTRTMVILLGEAIQAFSEMQGVNGNAGKEFSTRKKGHSEEWDEEIARKSSKCNHHHILYTSSKKTGTKNTHLLLVSS